MFDNWKKNRMIRKYLLKMPCLLQHRYGPNDFYTRGQIERTLLEEKFSSAYMEYAISIFSSPEEAINILKDIETYKLLRKEIAERYFNGDLNYKVRCNRTPNLGNEGHDSIGTSPPGGGGSD